MGAYVLHGFGLFWKTALLEQCFTYVSNMLSVPGYHIFVCPCKCHWFYYILAVSMISFRTCILKISGITTVVPLSMHLCLADNFDHTLRYGSYSGRSETELLPVINSWKRRDNTGSCLVAHPIILAVMGKLWHPTVSTSCHELLDLSPQANVTKRQHFSSSFLERYTVTIVGC